MSSTRPAGKIKLLHIALSMEHGGLERIINHFARNLDRDIFEMSICCLDGGGEFLNDLSGLSIQSKVLARKPGLVDFRVLWALTTHIHKEKIDIIHSHSGCSFYASVAAVLGGAKGVIHTDHGRLVPDRLSLILEDMLSSYVMNAYVAVSEQLARYLSSKARISNRKLHVIINGVDTTRFVPLTELRIKQIRNDLDIPEGAEIIGTICRLDPVKNLSFMIQTIRPVLEARERMFILIVGDGPDRENLETMVRHMRLGRKVKFLGKQNNIENIMPVFDAFVLPSISEGTSMTILEAMACGIPVIASAVGGNVDLIQEGVNGYLFPLDRPDILAQRVIELLDSPDKQRDLGSRGRDIAEKKFNLDRMMETYSSLYLKTIHRERHHETIN